MNIPHIISEDMSLFENWEQRLKSDDGFVRESIWRRHQCIENQKQSKWTGDYPRRRIVHIRDKYNFLETGFCLVDSYVWIHLSLPIQETKKYHDFILQNQSDHDLKIIINKSKNELEYTLSSYTPSIETVNLPWKIFDIGIRKIKERQHPKEVHSVEEILKYAPFQIELGCGPSIEAGIPALSYFHSVYSTTDEDEEFVFTLERDNLFKNLVLNPKNFYKQCTYPYLKCLQANHTLFHHCLRDMKENNILIEPVLSNNFDGLSKSIGIEEKNIYKFDVIYPKIDFVAKSLLVIGSHADRRKIREQARENNLQVIFIDPEIYNGEYYPVEDTQENDIILRMTANEFAKNYFKSTSQQLS